MHNAFNLPLLYTSVAIKEDSINYDAMMRAFKSLLTLEGQRCTVSHSTVPRGNTSCIIQRKYIFSILLK